MQRLGVVLPCWTTMMSCLCGRGQWRGNVQVECWRRRPSRCAVVRGHGDVPRLVDSSCCRMAGVNKISKVKEKLTCERRWNEVKVAELYKVHFKLRTNHEKKLNHFSTWPWSVRSHGYINPSYWSCHSEASALSWPCLADLNNLNAYACLCIAWCCLNVSFTWHFNMLFENLLLN
jgi:hypothetical protein